MNRISFLIFIILTIVYALNPETASKINSKSITENTIPKGIREREIELALLK